MEIIDVTTNVLEYFREKIITGKLKPGQRLNETSLSIELGVSRIPIREVFRLLEKDHLAVRISRKGTYVTVMNKENFIAASHVREMIECYAIDLLKASNIRDLPKVTSALDKAKDLPLSLSSKHTKPVMKRMKIFSGFHVSLIESVENPILESIYQSICYSLARYQFVYLHTKELTTQRSLNHHREMLDLIENGNYEKAKNELKKHLSHVMRLVADGI